MKILKYWIGLILILLLLFQQLVSAQSLTQNIRGSVIDADSRYPIVGANVFIPGTEPLLGASTDADGKFLIKNVPIGRIDLVISSIGYEDRMLNNIVIGSAKETIINADLTETLTSLQEVVVTDKSHASEPGNEFVLVSGLPISAEQTRRYAGSINDPARLVTGFAGIQGDPAGTNYIVVRGNSPITVQWRMNGLEIPNPNHFSEEGASGGAINMLSTNMLANSDFYTGAFTADYGNVLGSVFDMNLRRGNSEKREYSVGVGILGTDITLEGPFVPEGSSSYLVNYRYSTLAILSDLGILDFGGIPKYQDLAFNLNFPAKKAGVFSLFGIGGLSRIDEDYFEDDGETVHGEDSFKSYMGTLNLGHMIFIGSQTSFDSYVGLSFNGSKYIYKERNDTTNHFAPDYTEGLDKFAFRIGTTLNSKISSRHTLRTGWNYQFFSFDFNQEYMDDDKWVIGLLNEGNTGLLRGFASWKYRIGEDLTLTTGLNYQQFFLNEESLLEPRFSFRYALNEQQSVFGGFGLHSQFAPLPVYFAKVEGIDGAPNSGLKLMKARHVILGFDWILGRNLYLKSETYYQKLYDIPVEDDVNSSYSIINSVSGFTDKALVNAGTGTNYGLELTLERYFNKRYYFLATASLYESTYLTLDQTTRKTRFNTGHAVNFLAGKEFQLGGNENRILNVNTRFTRTGGFRFTPVLLDESIREGETVYDQLNTFGKAGDIFIKWDLAISYQWHRPKTRQEIKLEVQNLTNHQARTDERFDTDEGELVYDYQLPLFPVITYTIEF